MCAAVSRGCPVCSHMINEILKVDPSYDGALLQNWKRCERVGEQDVTLARLLLSKQDVNTSHLDM